MSNFIEIEGKLYHEDEGTWLLDEFNNPIPAHICICAAHSEYECVCGAWGIDLNLF